MREPERHRERKGGCDLCEREKDSQKECVRERERESMRARKTQRER